MPPSAGIRARTRRLAFAGAALALAPAVAQEGGPLHLRVNPSGYERPPEARPAPRPRETLEQKLARREREEYRFRSICRGCLPAEVEARMDARPARPRPTEPLAELPPEAASDAAPGSAEAQP